MCKMRDPLQQRRLKLDCLMVEQRMQCYAANTSMGVAGSSEIGSGGSVSGSAARRWAAKTTHALTPQTVAQRLFAGVDQPFDAAWRPYSAATGRHQTVRGRGGHQRLARAADCFRRSHACVDSASWQICRSAVGHAVR